LSKTGPSLSITVTVIVQVEVLPLASLAVNITVVVALPFTPELKTPLAFAPFPLRLLVMVTGLLQLSVAVANGIVTFALHNPGSVLTVIFAGQEVKTGNTLSTTVIVKVQVEVSPTWSVTLYVTVWVPIGKVAPGRCDFVQFDGPSVVQLSVAVGSVQLTTATQVPGSIFRIIFAGQLLIVGATLSPITIELVAVTTPQPPEAVMV
jgi:hypothetical protein